ncbi:MULTISPECIES: hypothetical protein [unclassified Streptomyces]|uniref:hypothetical protein n=1 Tax=unclassified Streptomyces TaxID=2593676 RepID=UPI002254CCA6|nr:MULTISPECIES: hypothetical protein [unclassified Streptomyces]MCX4526470.1 hypothetical protein [Streptomyces sp. NBC_01551]MCX4542967.1 hypothetical protein [Streptomyces sp. NBC_01565]
MYLVHAGLRASAPGAQFPVAAAELIRSVADADGLPAEHVSAHPHALPDPVVGVFLLADSLGEAERRAEALCRRALDVVPALRGWTLTRVGAPLVTPYYERLLLSPSGPAGRIGSGPLPSI